MGKMLQTRKNMSINAKSRSVRTINNHMSNYSQRKRKYIHVLYESNIFGHLSESVIRHCTYLRVAKNM